ncbi:MFS transporter [Pediococcus acidilactici]|uniref:MFS transporter n=1 Tax=Pediococcus acidilactici TaxID=1254 RepID=UPI001D019D27|nr:MFS transporter [Pediococcus acidilactici]MCB5723124.1 MFS transporter [Pediococcus acidilactici]MCB5729744.1 MFS transporter [Pediococcus acidilactici]MCB5731539.1 MFS transporter [Pediococcus acidilactici]MCB5764494.1 MFS transporter [Pediococcus acidilactici]MCB5773519.1 MFS transporter [Pediococcus acidilactici]
MKNRKLLIFTLAFGTFSILNTEVGILGILPLIGSRFGVSVATAGLFVSLFALVIAVFGSIMPVALKKFDRKKVMLLTLLLFTLANVIGGMVTSFNWALFFRLLPAILHPVYCSLAFTIAAETADNGQASKAVSRVMVGVSAGTVLGTPLTTLIANNISYSAAMYFFALVNFVALVLNFVVLPSFKNSADSVEELANANTTGVLKRGSLWVSGLGTILIGSTLFIVYGYVSDLLTQLSNFSSTQLSISLFVFGLMSMVGNTIAGNLLSKAPRKLVSMYPFLLMAVYLLVAFFESNTLMMFPVIVLWGMIYGIGNNIQQYLISAALPDALDLANGLFISLGNVGTSLGTSLGGVLLSSVGLGMLPIGGISILILTFIVVLVRNRMLRRELNEVEY